MLIISLDTKQKKQMEAHLFFYSPIAWQKSLVFNPAEPSIELFKWFIFGFLWFYLLINGDFFAIIKSLEKKKKRFPFHLMT